MKMGFVTRYTACGAAQTWILYAVSLLVLVSTIESRSTIERLFIKIQESQVKHNTDFKLFPFSWKGIQGTYPSDVKLNFHGNLQYYFVRDMFKVPDVNMFTPAWVTACLIESFEYGKSPNPSAEQVSMALNAMNRFRNHNNPSTNSEMTFWHQELNATSRFYESSPTNLLEVLRMPDYLPKKLIEEILELMGLKQLEDVLQKLFREKDMFAAAFHIPPDFDDTFVNVGVGSLLSQFQKDYPAGHKTWSSHNTDLSSVFEKVKKYAYRPFSSLPRESTIDPRTYMYLHDFIEKASANNQDIALITTWKKYHKTFKPEIKKPAKQITKSGCFIQLQDTEEVKSLLDKGVAMPFNVNNVDITVAANFIYGVLTCVGTGVCKPEYVDKDVQKIFMNTTALVSHEIMNNLSSRPDLALTYYPSKYEFYWFVSRSYAFLNRFLHRLTAPREGGLFNMMSYAYSKFRPALRQHMSADILDAIQSDHDGAYIDNFLGNGDVDIFNKTVKRAEDRLFTTAVSINALINTWTQLDNGSLHWDTGTPATVKKAVSQMCRWLDKFVLSSQYKPLNTFFSGSGKGLESMPFFYPANRMEYFNGTKFDDKSFPDDIHNIIGMQGAVTADQYSAMLAKPHFGRMTPRVFDGYNSDVGGYFPFWSSEAYTYATSLVALSHYENILN